MKIHNRMPGRLPTGKSVSDFAKKGVQKMEKFFASPGKIADKFLTVIEKDGSNEEKEIAHYAKLAASKSKTCKAGEFALRELAKEVRPPLPNILASIGYESLNSQISYKKGRAVGKILLKGIEKNADNPAQKALASTANKAASKKIADRSGRNVRQEAFHAILHDEPGIGGNNKIGSVLADAGLHAMKVADDSSDERLIGSAFLKEIRDSNIMNKEKNLASAVKKAGAQKLAPSSAAGAYKIALGMIKDGVKGNSSEALEQFNRNIEGNHLINDVFDGWKIQSKIDEQM